MFAHKSPIIITLHSLLADEEDAEEPYEKVRIRVSFPVLSEYSNQLELERWIPWDQVYGEEEDEESGGSTE